MHTAIKSLQPKLSVINSTYVLYKVQCFRIKEFIIEMVMSVYEMY